jgi:hypothetical protein
MDTGLTERQGVAALAAFFAKNGWYFREQFTHDWGIDAYVEIVRGGAPTGELIALQIKAGKSYFSNETDDSVPFPSDEKHSDTGRSTLCPSSWCYFIPRRSRCIGSTSRSRQL